MTRQRFLQLAAFPALLLLTGSSLSGLCWACRFHGGSDLTATCPAPAPPPLAAAWRTTQPAWPANNGFAGTPAAQRLPPSAPSPHKTPQDAAASGDIDRYGDDSGNSFGKPGEPLRLRATPYACDPRFYHRYRVLEPLPVQSGLLAPAFGSPGGATQYLAPFCVRTLLAAKVIAVEKGATAGADFCTGAAP